MIEKFYILLDEDNWIKNYIFWELELFKIIGYDLEFGDLVEKKFTDNKLEYFAKSSNEKNIEKLNKQIEWWKEYVAKNDSTLDNNPSPGNKKGGLTTILEKSLGAVSKAGNRNMVDVLDYAEQVKTKGLNFMNSPGYDPVSVTGQVASGANVICFTTGRGSCFGFKPTPSIKIATNTNMYNKLSEDMDINAGTIMDNVASVNEVGKEIFDKIISVASGEKSKSEINDYGDDEFNPWIIGATL